MKTLLRLSFAALLMFALVPSAFPQLGMFSKEQRIAITPQWKGERFDDGRPKVPDSILQGLSDVDAEEAWGVLQSHGYKFQFEGGWKEINSGGRMVGRVFTAVFMPQRPDVNDIINQRGKDEGRVGAQNSWPIDMLSPGDVLVVDLFGKIKDGTYAGDNLSTAIYAKSHNGLVVDGSVRDVTGISEIKGMHVFVRDFDPSALRDTTLMGINVPIRIGHVMVLPGDVAVSDPEGITFIPPQLAQDVIDRAQMVHAVDEWGHQMLREGKYTPGEIDRKWSKPMIQEFNKWLEQKGSKLRMPEE
ncbi:MAG TPA: RraA family protein [Terriglobia bacterium]|nr:RraA family protein [Terriglobia bacterium]